MTIDVDRYHENKAEFDELDVAIAALAARKSLGEQEERRLDTLRAQQKVIAAEIDAHTFSAMRAGVSPNDGVTPLTVESGHSPDRDLDSDY
jgi:hypothetical protein